MGHSLYEPEGSQGLRPGGHFPQEISFQHSGRQRRGETESRHPDLPRPAP